MDEHDRVFSGPAEDADASGYAGDTAVEEACAGFVGRWRRLVSTTNWEKGRIICEWRERLVEDEAPAVLFSDEAWSRRVGCVSPQHVGRLRRVHQRFGEVFEQYAGLYWSHFQAALDWHDAEMWLEGAVQNGWSVARMRRERWQAMGSPADQIPREEDLVEAEPDEDYEAANDSVSEMIGESLREVRDLEAGAEDREAEAELPDPLATGHLFDDVPALPLDLSDAVEAMKLAIGRHRRSGWSEVSPEAVLAALAALGQLVADGPRGTLRFAPATQPTPEP